jgi:hypothetical protein
MDPKHHQSMNPDPEMCFDRIDARLRKRLDNLDDYSQACDEAGTRAELILLFAEYPRWWKRFHLVKALVESEDLRFLRGHPTLWQSCAGGTVKQLGELHAGNQIQCLLHAVANAST